MKFIDLLRMSSSSLFKRKIRTILTVLGVVIGTASIVVMISLGLGLNKSTMEQIDSNGGLTTIYVSEAYEDFESADGGASAEKKRLDKELVEALQQLPKVKAVSPALYTSVILKQGSYEMNTQLQGMTTEGLENLKLEFEAGGLPEQGAPLQFVYGSSVEEDFYNSKTGQYPFWETGELPDIHFMDQPMFVIFDTDAYYSSQYPSEEGQSGEQVKAPKKYMIDAAGKVAKPTSGYDQNSWNVYCDIDALETQLKKIFKNKVIPGQPTKENGKPYKELYYSQIQVSAETMDDVAGLQTIIKDMGYQADSNAEWVSSMQEQYKSIQLVLGGIGAVSLFVAAIGITNTMMMSIYERTKEIGVIKVLGCSLGNIRTLFLLEAAYIGLLGGIIGVLLSYGISSIINNVAASMDSYQTSVSYIPAWLSLLGLAFSTVVGMVAGFFPALRAMRLSPLAAIRNE